MCPQESNAHRLKISICGIQFEMVRPIMWLDYCIRVVNFDTITLGFKGAVVSIGHLTAFYVVFVPLEYVIYLTYVFVFKIQIMSQQYP